MGGALIGTAATLMLVFHGRVTGISGILSSSLFPPYKDSLWRYLFLSGLVVGGLVFKFLLPDNFLITERPLYIYIIAGLLVGFGTVYGSGCTSGHGVCGISRFSIRSVIATMTFIIVGIITTYLMRNL